MLPFFSGTLCLVMGVHCPDGGMKNATTSKIEIRGPVECSVRVESYLTHIGGVRFHPCSS